MTVDMYTNDLLWCRPPLAGLPLLLPWSELLERGPEDPQPQQSAPGGLPALSPGKDDVT